ncbi:MAG: hypothetical protein MSG64_06835 [Pyrinomonadaceae bacterium MAG19_C2-C3]|nr:hypothetical protein [Pyrinomonadaceae bacterium MAG19_C2-C3]
MNRKLIRTTLAQIKEREANHKEAMPTGEMKASNGARLEASRSNETSRSNEGSRSNTNAAAQGRKRAPTLETNAEAFYYKKQMESHTAMVFMLQDGEELEGTIEWYDRAAFKVNRNGAANILLLKHNVKYMYKADDRVDE